MLLTHSFNLLLMLYVDACVLSSERVCVCTCCLFFCLTGVTGWEIIHILSERSVIESTACACLDSFVWMSSDARTAVVSGQNIMQPAEPWLSTLLHWQRRMKRVREWEHPVICWLSNAARERERDGERAGVRARECMEHREMRLSGTNRLYHWLQRLSHTTTAAALVFPARMSVDQEEISDVCLYLLSSFCQ